MARSKSRNMLENDGHERARQPILANVIYLKMKAHSQRHFSTVQNAESEPEALAPEYMFIAMTV
jgi:hypothetical protein